MTLENRQWKLRPGVVFVFRPGEKPSATHLPENPLLVFTAHFQITLPVPGGFHEILDMSALEANTRVAVSAWSRGDRSGQQRTHCALWQILLQLQDEAQRKGTLEQDDRVSRLVAQIDRNPAQRWNLSEMAESVHMSPSTFYRVFRTMTGLPPQRYLQNRRLQQAANLLRESRMSIAEIATALGYDDPSFFTRQFTRLTGSSPGNFRKNTA